MTPKVTKLVTQQTNRFATMRRMIARRKKMAREHSNILTVPIIRARLEQLEKYWNEARIAHDELFGIRKPEAENYIESEQFEEMETEYEAETDNLKVLLYHRTDSSVLSSPRVNQHHVAVPLSSKLRLPKSTLPTFSGNYEDWGNFSDLFLSMIDGDATIPPVVKLQYLKQCLSGEAADFVKDIKVEDNNYQPTWDALKNRYCNVRLLIHTNFNILYKLPKLQKESVTELKNLIDKTRQAVRSLKNIGRNVMGDWLVYHTAERLDPSSRREWESVLSKKASRPGNEEIEHYEDQYPSFDELAKFIDDRIITLNMFPQQAKVMKRSFNTITTMTRSQTCPKRAAEHYIGRCPSFKCLNFLERRNEARRLKLCFNCLGPHQIKNCKSKGRCFECNQLHHTLLHRPPLSESIKKSSQEKSSSENLSHSNTQRVHSCTTAISTIKRKILLATACVGLEGPNNKTKVRAMFDQGSEVSFITEEVAKQLELPRFPTNITIVGLGNQCVGKTQTKTMMKLKSLHDPAYQLNIEAYVVPNLTTTLPSGKLIEIDLECLKNETLADPYYYQPGTIQLIIGADYYGQLLRPGLYQIQNPTVTAQNTILGWIISGPIVNEVSRRAVVPTITAMHCVPADTLQNELQRFWELEEIPLQDRDLKPDEKQCELHFQETHARTPEGRYLLRLLVTSQPPDAAEETRKLALGSLLSMERRFRNDARLVRAYEDFMERYELDDHMEKVPANELKYSTGKPVWYLPHHGVVQANNLNWKLRVVFNASRKTSQNQSINDFFHIGPALQNDLTMVLMNWRRHEFVFTADMVKMYRQILIDPEDRDLQRILWRSHRDEPPVEYRLKTVTYGTACAPYMAIRTIHQLTKDEGALYPLGAECLRNNIYVDDIFDGANELSEAQRIRDEVIALAKKGKFDLDKWASNHPELIPNRNTSHFDHTPKLIDKNEAVKTLGILWDPQKDHFSFSIAEETLKPLKLTKRTISSCVAKLYDPLGWITPITVFAKITLQNLWILRIDWDEPVPNELQDNWTHYTQSLMHLPSIKIPRWLGIALNSLYEIHAFCDASTRAYAASVYLRVVNADGNVQVSLLTAKSKVSPVKTITIPKLELCGAALLVKLLKHVRKLPFLHDTTITAWSDSQVVLAWLNQHPSQWKTFVANRVSYIQTELPSMIWRHVPTNQNPADLATRGVKPETLRDLSLWWQGPFWLSASREGWPSQSPTKHEEEIIQSFIIRKPLIEADLLTRFSSLQRLLRVTAYCLRFAKNCQHKMKGKPRTLSFLTPAELDTARISVFAMAQAQPFAEEISALQSGQFISRQSILRKFNPLLDSQNILRVGGRLGNSSLGFSFKHPPILHKQSPISKLYVDLAHKISCHGGPKLTLSILQSFVWIIGGNQLVRRIVRQCVRCHRMKPQFPHQLMGNLPATRIEPSRPFTNSGLDYAGPFQIRTTKGRGHRSYKGYVVVFVCFATKAIHLEAVSDLTTAAFLAAFRRFTSRRGLCQRLYSDNGTNFKGADKELRSMFKAASAFYSEVASTLANDQVEWNFIPPSSPHFGGLWEAGVKSAKYHLVRLLNNHSLTFEEFSTILAQIEACLNSRPLCAIN